MRTDEEIIARVREIAPREFLGTQTAELLSRLEFEKARPFLVKDATADGWRVIGRDRDAVVAEMREYMPFATGKAIDHRGISADRSIEHFRGWVWLLGDEDFAAIDWDRYPNYGAPILKQIADRYVLEFPDDASLLSMAAGNGCTPGCDSGCGR